jgi:hypothetical protein
MKYILMADPLDDVMFYFYFEAKSGEDRSIR